LEQLQNIILIECFLFNCSSVESAPKSRVLRLALETTKFYLVMIQNFPKVLNFWKIIEKKPSKILFRVLIFGGVDSAFNRSIVQLVVHN